MNGPFGKGGPIRPLAVARSSRSVEAVSAPTVARAGAGRMGYPLDNDHPLAAAYHACLSALLDRFSRARVCDLFPGGLSGKRCLEVGAGVGARFALWLADQVGPSGRVAALDIKPRDIPEHPRLDVLECDLTSPNWPSIEPADFVHARLVLAHLPQRRQILTRLIGLLKPGGRILIEEWDTSRHDMVLCAPSGRAAEEYAVMQEMVGRIFGAAGSDHTFARRVHPALLADGLTDVHTVMHAESWAGGPGAQLCGLTIAQLRPALLAAGLTDRQLDRAHQLLSDPRLVLAGHPLHSTSGRRPDPHTTIHKGA